MRPHSEIYLLWCVPTNRDILLVRFSSALPRLDANHGAQRIEHHRERLQRNDHRSRWERFREV